MKKPGKAIIIFLLIQFLISSFAITPAFAYRYEEEAAALHVLGILDGCSTQTFDPDLGSRVQRQTAVILIVKMFGEKDAAGAMPQSEVDEILSRFSDSHRLAPFARPYMAYAVKTGMVAGTSPTTLGPEVWVDGVSFACMILKNMGYTVDSRETFLRSLEILGELSGMDEQTVAILNKDILTRDEVVGIIYAALQAKLPDGRPLIAELIRKGFISSVTAARVGFVPDDTIPGSGMILPGFTPKPTDREMIYELIRDALLSVSTSVTLPINTASDTAEEVFAIWQEVLDDTPEILYNSSLNYRSDGYVTFLYSKDVQVVKKHKRLLEEKAESILKGLLRPGMTDYEKELAVHDYIVNNCVYDLSSPRSPESFTAYGALCLGKAVCEGYARATKLLLDLAGVECRLIDGQAMNSNTGRYQSHAWNLVRIDGQYYHLDTTWDDPVMNDGSQRLVHTYFNLPDEEIGRDHIWDRSRYPACIATEYNYYAYNDLIAIGYDAFVSYVVEKANAGSSTVTARISWNEKVDYDLNQAIKEIQSRTNKRIYAYKPVDSYGIIELFFK